MGGNDCGRTKRREEGRREGKTRNERTNERRDEGGKRGNNRAICTTSTTLFYPYLSKPLPLSVIFISLSVTLQEVVTRYSLTGELNQLSRSFIREEELRDCVASLLVLSFFLPLVTFYCKVNRAKILIRLNR